MRLIAHECFAQVNLLEHWHTELGANVMNIRRWRAERKKISTFETEDASQDGLVAHSLVYWGWHSKRVHSADSSGCLFDHNPNPHACMLVSNDTFWDDSSLECVTRAEKDERTTRLGYTLHHAEALPHLTELYAGRCILKPQKEAR